jgi:hypothetical protein
MTFIISVTDEHGEEVLHKVEAKDFDEAVCKMGLDVLTGRLSFNVEER